MEGAVDGVIEITSEITTGAVNEMKSMFHLDELSSYFTWANLAKVVTSVIAILIFWFAY